jgi:hypothetical protein
MNPERLRYVHISVSFPSSARSWAGRRRNGGEGKDHVTIRKRRLANPSLVAGTALAALALFTAPHASAAAGSVRGYSQEPTRFGSLASCQNVFTGSVTADQGDGRIVAAVNDVRFSFCRPGTAVTAAALPWTLDFRENSGYTINGVQVNITTYRGVCRYSGTLNGFMQLPGAYDLRGSLSRRNGDCGGPDQIHVGNLIEVISVSR